MLQVDQVIKQQDMKGKKKIHLSVVRCENQGQVITRADSGGKELLLMSQPDTGSLKHKKQHIILLVNQC